MEDFKISEKVSRKISNMSLLCAILVVSIHIPWCDGFGGRDWWVMKIIRDGLAQIAVPYFFCVSGFFLANRYGEQDWWKIAVKKRVLSLGVPFLIWSPVALISFKLSKVLSNVVNHCPWQEGALLTSSELMCLFGLIIDQPPLCYVFWFIRTLLIFVVISPILFWLKKKCVRIYF